MQQAASDPAVFASLVFTTDLGDPMIPMDFHQEWLTILREGPKYLQILAPRGHAKSEYLGLVYVAWYIATHPTHRVLMISSTDDMASRFVTRIAETFRRSEEFAAIFPDFPAVTRSNMSEIRLASSPRDPALRAVGWGTTVTGARADLIILEDVATNENQSEDALRRKMKKFLTATLMPILVPGGRMLAVGTPYNDDDIYVALREQAGFDEFSYDCYRDGNMESEPLWPSRYSSEALKEIHTRVGTRDFTTQYRCQRAFASGDVFQREWFEPYVEAMPEMKELWLVFDLAISIKRSADYTVAMLGGLTKQNDVLVMNVWRNRWAPEVARKQFADLYARQQRRWGSKLRGLLSESTKENEVMRDWMRDDDATRTIPVVLDPWTVQDKYTRASEILPFCEARRVQVLKGAFNDELMNEVLAFSKDDSHAYDDQVDCLVTLTKRCLGVGREPRVRILTIGR